MKRTVEAVLDDSFEIRGRYCLKGHNIELTGGDGLSVQVNGTWVLGCVEYSGERRGYYHVGTNLTLEAIREAGLLVRVVVVR